MGTCLTKNNYRNQQLNIDQSDINNIIGNTVPNQLISPYSKINNTLNSIDDFDESKQLKSQQKSRLDKSRVKKLIGNFDEDNDDFVIHEKVVKINKKIMEKDSQFILKVLKSHFVFSVLDEKSLVQIIQKMFYCQVESGEYIFQQGDKASCYFIIESGLFDIIINGEVKKQLKNGDFFGELALLYSSPRSASVKSVEQAKLWAIDRKTFRKAVEDIVCLEYESNRKFIDEVKFFQNMTNEQKDAIAGVLISQKFHKGEVVVGEGDQADSLYIIKEGSVSVIKGQKEIRKMVQGETFGEQALYQNSIRQCTVVANEENTKCMALGREGLVKLLGDQVQNITVKNVMKWAFDKSQLLCQLTKIQREKIVDQMIVQNVKQGEVIYQKGQLCSKMVILIEGNLRSSIGEKVCQKGLIYGDIFMKEQNQNKMMQENIFIDQDGIITYIDFKNFYNIIGGKIEEVIKKNQYSHEKLMQQNQEKIDFSDIKLDDLINIKKLGQGQFGNVYLTKNKENRKYYALKCISKAQVIAQNLEKHLASEKNVMESINFPFIMQFVRSFKDTNSIYFLLEYIRGMELFDVIRDIGLLGTFDSLYYIGTLILCLEYLHSKNIIYRDLKPENIMINEMGHLMMIDMGTAKHLKVRNSGVCRTFTIIGTPHYMAPEIITGKGYGFPVDLWSLGIIFYEFMCGGLPFAEEADDPYVIYEEIIQKQIKFPDFLRDKRAKALMLQLLQKVPELRLGGSYAALKSNQWFNNFDWDKLYNRELKPPYIPSIENMISNTEIEKIATKGELINQVLQKDKVLQKYKKELAKDQNWDKEF